MRINQPTDEFNSSGHANLNSATETGSNKGMTFMDLIICRRSGSSFRQLANRNSHGRCIVFTILHVSARKAAHLDVSKTTHTNKHKKGVQWELQKVIKVFTRNGYPIWLIDKLTQLMRVYISLLFKLAVCVSHKTKTDEFDQRGILHGRSWCHYGVKEKLPILQARFMFIHSHVPGGYCSVVAWSSVCLSAFVTTTWHCWRPVQWSHSTDQ